MDQEGLSEFSPLVAFSSHELELFAKSVTFSDRGLSGFDMSVFENLNVTQTYRVLSLFGLQRISVDVAGYIDSDSPTDKLILARETTQKVDKSSPSSIQSDWYDSIGDGDFLEGYRCHAPGTCKKSSSYACTKNC